MNEFPLSIEAIALAATAALVLVLLIFKCFRVVRAGNVEVVERLGLFARVMQPGLSFRLWPIERIRAAYDMNERSIALEDQECFSADGIKIKIDATLHARFFDARLAAYGALDPWRMARASARAALGSAAGSLELRALIGNKELIANHMLESLQDPLRDWGLLIERIEITNLCASEGAVAAIEALLKAEREKRARIAKSEGVMEARINAARASKEEIAHKSEGTRKRLESEAEGRASSMLSMARASADALRTIGAAMSEAGGQEAARYTIIKRYIEALGALSKKDSKITIGLDLCSPTRDPYQSILFGAHEEKKA
jgi:regulator of protease activity HflC (stomatin/prohibitin superfamily)